MLFTVIVVGILAGIMLLRVVVGLVALPWTVRRILVGDGERRGLLAQVLHPHVGARSRRRSGRSGRAVEPWKDRS